MRRRQVLATGAAVGGSAVIGGYLLESVLAQRSGARVWPVGDPSLAGRRIKAFAEEVEGVGALAKAYFDHYLGGHRDEAQLVALLVPRLTQGAGAREGEATIADALAVAVSADFEANRICFVDGWYLSETECALAGLAALVQDVPLDTQPGEPSNASPFDKAEEAKIVDVERWGPQSTVAGQPFNVQPDGHSGMWFVIDSPPRSLEVYVNGNMAKTTVQEDVVTVGLYGKRRDRLIDEPGEHEVWLYDKVTGRKQRVGQFEVRPKPEYAKLDNGERSKHFCRIENWGPKRTEAGQSFNEQPDGKSAFWIRIACAPPTTVLYVDDRPLNTTVREELVTASFDATDAVAEPGRLTLRLKDKASGEVLTVGEFRVQQAE